MKFYLSTVVLWYNALVMHFRPYFTSWASEVDKFLASYLAKRAREAKKSVPIAGDLITDFADFIVGGKRLRAGLVRLGYEAFAGKEPKKVIPIAAAVEILHGAFLVHDDIIDADLVRHNKPTIHIKYSEKRKAKSEKLGNNFLHYGESLAIVAGDIALFEANRLVLSSVLEDKTKQKIALEFQNIAITTGFGEALDIELPYLGKRTEGDVLTIHRLKTAYYTYVGPLTYGALAALGQPKDGALEKRARKAIQDYALPVGLAFQLQDDILGMFGDEKTLGKPVDSDIKEGKNTLLYVEALRRASREDKVFLGRVWGSSDITAREVDRARKIIRDTGALEYSIRTAEDLVKKGKRAIPKLTHHKELQEVFLTLADYTIGREK